MHQVHQRRQPTATADASDHNTSHAHTAFLFYTHLFPCVVVSVRRSQKWEKSCEKCGWNFCSFLGKTTIASQIKIFPANILSVNRLYYEKVWPNYMLKKRNLPAASFCLMSDATSLHFRLQFGDKSLASKEWLFSREEVTGMWRIGAIHFVWYVRCQLSLKVSFCRDIHHQWCILLSFVLVFWILELKLYSFLLFGYCTCPSQIQ